MKSHSIFWSFPAGSLVTDSLYLGYCHKNCLSLRSVRFALIYASQVMRMDLAEQIRIGNAIREDDVDSGLAERKCRKDRRIYNLLHTPDQCLSGVCRKKMLFRNPGLWRRLFLAAGGAFAGFGSALFAGRFLFVLACLNLCLFLVAELDRFL